MTYSSTSPQKEGSSVAQSAAQETGVSFRFLNICQFIGAMNDNVFKLLLAFCFINLEGPASSNRILAMAGGVYVLPFILLSTTAGILADKYSKRSIIIGTRVAEIASILVGILAFGVESKYLAFFALLLLSSHSAIFGPCKYGIVPEIVPKELISKANGILTSFSYVAIIVGTFLAAFLTDITDKNFVLALVISGIFSIFSLLSSFKIQRTPPAGSHKKVSPKLISQLINNIRVIRREPSLLPAVLGSSFFLFAGSYVQLNMIPFALNSLGLSEVQGGYMFLLTALGIGIGSLLAGKLSGKAVELGLVPFGGIGMATSCLLLHYWSHNLPVVLTLVFLIGFFGGTYLVPLESYIQVTSPAKRRGQIVATVNVLGFFGVLLSAISMYIISEVVGLPPDQGFVIIGSVTLVMAISISFSVSGYIVRFVSFIMSFFCFPSYLKGKEQIPLDTPSIFFVPHSFWPWAPVLLASQRRRMRLFTLNPQTKPPLIGELIRRLIRIKNIYSMQEILPEGIYAESIHHAISRGTSIAIFCSKKNLSDHVYPFLQAWAEEKALQNVSFFSVNTTDDQEDHDKPWASAHIEKISL